MRASPIISARNIQKSFYADNIQCDVLKNVSVDIYSGELTLILGPSGSGKSTLLAALGGLLRPDSGAIMVNDRDIGKLKNSAIEELRLSRFGFVFQGFNLFSSLTSQQQISLILEYCGFNPEEVKHRSQRALRQVGLEDKAMLTPQSLSGGEKQRVAIARATAKSPDVLFADEPTSNLDTQNSFKIIELLKKLANNNNTAVVLVTHDSRLMHYAQRVHKHSDWRVTIV